MKIIPRNQSIFFSAMLLILLGVACSETSPLTGENVVKLGETVQKKAPGQVTISIGEGDLLKINVLEIGDSRCAEDVICIWEGEVNVKFQIEDLEKLFTLCLTTLCNSQEVVYNGRKFLITLIDVTPYPNTSRPDSSKNAVFSVIEI